MARQMNYSEAKEYCHFIDNMRNPDMRLQMYPFDLDMTLTMFKEDNIFFNILPSYQFGEETVCAYLAYKALTDSEFDLCLMADTPEKYRWLISRIQFFIMKSRFSLITKLLAYSRLKKHYYVGIARYVYVAEYEKTFDLDDNCFVGWVHPGTDDGLTDDNRPFIYGTHAIAHRMHDMRLHTIITGKDQYDILKTQLGKYILYFDATENTSI